MNLDRKFLEGFSEVSAANGLPPSQAHQLLMKEAKIGGALKLLGLGAGATGLGIAGTKYGLDKFNESLINSANRTKDYYNEGVYGYGVPEPAAVATTPTPHYTSWGEDNSIDNKQWDSSIPATTAVASPKATPTTPTLSAGVRPITESSMNAKEITEAQGQYDRAKQEFSEVNRKIEDANKQFQLYRNRLTSPNMVRESFLIGPAYNWWNSRGFQNQADKLKELTELQRDRQEQFTAAERARENAMK